MEDVNSWKEAGRSRDAVLFSRSFGTSGVEFSACIGFDEVCDIGDSLASPPSLSLCLSCGPTLCSLFPSNLIASEERGAPVCAFCFSLVGSSSRSLSILGLARSSPSRRLLLSFSSAPRSLASTSSVLLDNCPPRQIRMPAIMPHRKLRGIKQPIVHAGLDE